jgi:hypothetical protein
MLKLSNPSLCHHSLVFDDLIDKVSNSEFLEFFNLEILEHSNFKETTARQFIIRVMSNEKRPDKFVHAHYSRKLRGGNNRFLGGLIWMMRPLSKHGI